MELNSASSANTDRNRPPRQTSNDDAVISPEMGDDSANEKENILSYHEAPQWLDHLFILLVGPLCIGPVFNVPILLDEPYPEDGAMNNSSTEESKYHMRETLLSEWEEFKDPDAGHNLKVMFFAMLGLGSLLGGVFSDIFGRLNTFHFGCCIMILSGLACSFPGSVTSFRIFFLIQGCMVFLMYLPLYLRAVESLPDKRWRLAYMLLCEAWPWKMGLLVSRLLAYTLHEWRLMIFISACTMLIFLFMRKVILSCYIENLPAYSGIVPRCRRNSMDLQNSEAQISPKALTYLIRISVLMLNWFSIAIAYYGLLMSEKSIVTQNKQLNIFLEIPFRILGALLAIAACYKTNLTKSPTAVLLVMNGIAILVVTFYLPCTVETTCVRAIGIISVSSQVMSAGAWIILYALTVSLFPQKIRGTCLGICSGSARLGMIAGTTLVDKYAYFEGDTIASTTGCLIILFGLLIMFCLPEKHGILKQDPRMRS